jgi:hypothetical protein
MVALRTRPGLPRRLNELFWAVHQQLGAHATWCIPRTVALRLPYQGGFHIDLVPGRAQDGTYQCATLSVPTIPGGPIRALDNQ